MCQIALVLSGIYQVCNLLGVSIYFSGKFYYTIFPAPMFYILMLRIYAVSELPRLTIDAVKINSADWRGIISAKLFAVLLSCSHIVNEKTTYTQSSYFVILEFISTYYTQSHNALSWDTVTHADQSIIINYCQILH